MTTTDNKPHPLSLFAHCPRCGSPFVPNNAKSKRCPACGFVYYFHPSAATVAVFRNADGRILASRRAKEPARGTLDLPGGFCDLGETAEQGVAREVLEETGLTVTRARYLFSLPNVYPYSGLDVHTMDLFFDCQVEQGAEPKAMDDAAELLWLDPASIRPSDFGLASIRRGMAMLLAGRSDKQP